MTQSAHAASFPCTTSTLILSAQDGPVGDPSTWVGGTIPRDGNCVVIRHHVTLDSDWGSEGGTGLGWVRVENGGLFDSDCQSAHNVYFGSFGTNPTGSGSSGNPGADASMFGFFVADGTLSLSCAQPQNVTIDSSNASVPWYIHHDYRDYVGCTQITNNVCNGTPGSYGSALNLQNVEARHVGANVDGFSGIDWDMSANLTPPNSLMVAKNHFLDLHEISSGGFPAQTGSFNVTSNWFDSPWPETSQGLLYLVGNISSWVVNDNTVTGAQTSSFLVNAPDGISQLQMMRNAVEGSATTQFSLFANASGAGNILQFNLCVNPEPPGPVNNPCVYIAGSSGDRRTSVSYNIMQGGHSGISQIGEQPTWQPTFSFNWISQWNEDWEAQGAIITRSGVITETYNVLVMEHQVNDLFMLGNLAYSDTSGNCGASVHQDHNTIDGVDNLNGDGNVAFNWGDNGTSPHTCVVSSYVRSNIGYGSDYGYINRNNYNTWSSNSGIIYGGAAVHHNLDWNNRLGNYVNTQTSAGFDNGVIHHPSHSQYGDLSEDPQFLDHTRRPAGWDFACGGPGTNDSLFQNLARRSGFGGIYNACYSIPPLWRWIRLGWAPLNRDLLHAAHDGTYIGAVSPVTGN
jgi:hypothetical protein